MGDDLEKLMKKQLAARRKNMNESGMDETNDDLTDMFSAVKVKSSSRRPHAPGKGKASGVIPAAGTGGGGGGGGSGIHFSQRQRDLAEFMAKRATQGPGGVPAVVNRIPTPAAPVSMVAVPSTTPVNFGAGIIPPIPPGPHESKLDLIRASAVARGTTASATHPPPLPPKPSSLMVKPSIATTTVSRRPSVATTPAPAAVAPASVPVAPVAPPPPPATLPSTDLQSPNQIFNKLLKLIQQNNKHARVDLNLPVKEWGLDPSLIGALEKLQQILPWVFERKSPPRPEDEHRAKQILNNALNGLKIAIRNAVTNRSSSSVAGAAGAAGAPSSSAAIPHSAAPSPSSPHHPHHSSSSRKGMIQNPAAIKKAIVETHIAAKDAAGAILEATSYLPKLYNNNKLYNDTFALAGKKKRIRTSSSGHGRNEGFAAGESFIIPPGEGPTTIAIRKENHEIKKEIKHLEQHMADIRKDIKQTEDAIERLMNEIRDNRGVIEGFGRGGQPRGTKFKTIMKKSLYKK